MNQELIKQYADLILNMSLTITPYNQGNQTLFKYEHNSIISTIIKKNLYKFKHEIDDHSILRDETYASYYESLLALIAKENYTQEEMELIIADYDTHILEITQTFIKLLIGYTNNLLKTNLIDHTRRDRSNNEDNYITTKITYDEELLKYIPNEESNDEEEHSELYYSLLELLTESQKEYITGEKVYDNKETEKKVKQRIKERVNTMTDERRKEILDMVETEVEVINNILDIEEDDKFIKTIKERQNTEWFSDMIIDHVSPQHRTDFNKGNITKATVWEYRKALFESLGRF